MRIPFLPLVLAVAAALPCAAQAAPAYRIVIVDAINQTFDDVQKVAGIPIDDLLKAGPGPAGVPRPPRKFGFVRLWTGESALHDELGAASPPVTLDVYGPTWPSSDHLHVVGVYEYGWFLSGQGTRLTEGALTTFQSYRTVSP